MNEFTFLFILFIIKGEIWAWVALKHLWIILFTDLGRNHCCQFVFGFFFFQVLLFFKYKILAFDPKSLKKSFGVFCVFMVGPGGPRHRFLHEITILYTCYFYLCPWIKKHVEISILLITSDPALFLCSVWHFFLAKSPYKYVFAVGEGGVKVRKLKTLNLGQKNVTT